MVDEASHFRAASLFRNNSTKKIWSKIQHMWSHVYLGPPDCLAVDQFSAYILKNMKESLEVHSVQLQEAPIEAAGAIETVKRYHGPFSLSYQMIRAATGRETSDQECLDLMVFAIIRTVGPGGLCRALFVFDAILQPARLKPPRTHLERPLLIVQALKEVEKRQAQRRITFGLRHTGMKKGAEL